MRYYELLAFVASATAAAIPEAEPAPNGGGSSSSYCPPNSGEVAISKAAFYKAKLVPPQPAAYNNMVNLVPSFNPDTTIHVAYDKAVEYGNKFQTTETVMQPSITFQSEPDSRWNDYNYTVIMLDPDALSPAGTLPGPNLHDYLHWIYYDAKPCIERKQQPMAKDQPMYIAPTPPSPQAHRYTQLVYRQPKGTYMPPSELEFPQTTGTDRGGFKLNEYVAAGKLQGPVAGNYFLEAAPVIGGSS